MIPVTSPEVARAPVPGPLDDRCRGAVSRSAAQLTACYEKYTYIYRYIYIEIV